MRLSRKVLVLYAGRILLISFITFPLLSLEIVYFTGIYLIFLCALFLTTLFFYLHYHFCSLEKSENFLIFRSGFLIRRIHIIPLNFICATRFIKTPLSLALGLLSPVIYCEGTKTTLPPLTKHQLKKHELLRTKSIET